MKLSRIVLRLRLANTRFGNFIGGVAEIDLVMRNTLNREMAFVIPLVEDAAEEAHDQGLVQDVIERFGVIVALENDTTQKDKTGIIAYDKVEDIRAELFKALLGWQMEQGTQATQSVVEYRGARLLDINRGWMWYQYEFEYLRRYTNVFMPETGTSGDGVEISGFDSVLNKEIVGLEALGKFEKIVTQYVLDPSVKSKAALEEAARGLPISMQLIDAEQFIDLTDDPRDGAFDFGFGSGFDRKKE